MSIDMMQIDEMIANKDYWNVQQILVDAKMASSDIVEQLDMQNKINEVYSIIKEITKTNKEVFPIKFGTSGWRAIIGENYTVENVKRVTQAVVNMTYNDEFLKEINVNNHHEVEQRGVLLGYDSRFMGKDFAKAAAQVLTANDIKVYWAGEATTAELSGAIVELGCAFSINLTPSHNPFEWAGYKFNPADGGPAGANLTTIIEAEFEKIANGESDVKIVDEPVIEFVDTIEIYKEFIENKKQINLDELIKQINASDIKLVFDNVYGATRGRMQKLLFGVEQTKISYLRTQTDTLFGGVKPEPSSKNMQLSIDKVNKSTSKFKIGCIMDPDGDRIRFTDGKEEIEMNFFGAMALYYFGKVQGKKGSLAKSVATSNFANAVADKLGIKVNETAVGFKEFREYLNDDALVAFEESDGITIGKHTLEKDALIGALLSIKMVLDMQKNLGEIRQEVEDFAGKYYPGRDGVEVDRSLAGSLLKEKLSKLNKFDIGDIFEVGGVGLKIADKLTLDGYKFVLEDGSWLLIRPSGTEPKVRFYVEGRSESQRDQLTLTAKKLLDDCLA
jgi:phosphomannomutase